MKKILSVVILVIIGIIFSNSKFPVTSILHDIKNVSTQDHSSKSSLNKSTDNTNADEVIYFPSDKYPETAKHISDAIAKGESEVCTIDREGAEENRNQSLKDVPTKKGYDRDEWPMAFCAEGGEGADIEYISPSDNRGAGSWVSHKLSDYPDGTRVLFTIK
ncbi:endonuclease [Bacillus subtilis]|uniref:Endonuclease n=1 Tax=Bacillus subtilis TaxID=1423 RepID=A0A0D1KUB7_BACIU|nr:endonuclease [Bacillus subtilis]